MDEGRVVLERLDEVRLHRVLQKHRHRAVGLDVTGVDRRAVAAVGHDHVAQAPLEVFEVGGEAEDRHDLGRHGDVEARLAREAVRHAAQVTDDRAQRPVVHVENAPPGDAANVDALLVAPVDVVVDHRRQEVVGRGDRVEIAGEVEVHLLHGHDLRVAAARGPALHPEVGAKRGLADADHRLLADGVEPVAEAHRRGGLSLACGRRVDRGHEDQVPVGLAFLGLDEVGRHLGLVMAVGQERVGRNIQLRADLLDRFFVGFAGDFDVGHEACLSMDARVRFRERRRVSGPPTQPTQRREFSPHLVVLPA